jgi:hypothetical protein
VIDLTGDDQRGRVMRMSLQMLRRRDALRRIMVIQVRDVCTALVSVPSIYARRKARGRTGWRWQRFAAASPCLTGGSE